MGYLDKAGLSRAFTKLKTLIDKKADVGHTHNYAGSSSAGGSANSAVKLDSSAGGTTQPVYFSGGKPAAIAYTIGKSVPSDAKFTDTTYGTGSSTTAGLTKLYTGTGSATDGTMTQSAITSALSGKANASHTHTKSQITDFAHDHSRITSKGTHAETASGTTANAPTAGMADATSGVYLTQSYDDSAAPTTYGNILNIVGAGTGQLFMGWSGNDSTTEHLYYRSHRDTSTGGWGKWNTIIDSSNIGTQSVRHANTAGSVAWSNVSGRPSSMPASDVYSWAKQPHKPSYTASEVGAAPASHSHSYLPLSGGTMSGRILRGAGGSWISARNNAIAFGTTANSSSYNPVVGQKTTKGAWTVGNLAGDERLVFSYDTDANFNAGNNASNATYLPIGNTSQEIITSATIGSQSVSHANTAGSVAWNNISGKPNTYTPSSHTHTKSQISDFPSKLEPYFANNTWYVVGDDAAIGDHNKGGAFCIKGLNGTPNVSLYNSDDSYYGQCITTADIGSQSVNWANGANYANYAFSENGVSTAGNGSVYTAAVSGFSLATGKSIVMIPNVTSTTTTPTLNVSNTGPKNIRMRLSSSTSSTIPLIRSDFLTQNKPVKVTYDGTYWVIDDFIQPDANNLYGTLISRGSSAPSSGTAGFIYIQTT